MIKKKDNSLFRKLMIGLVSTLGIFVLFMGTSIASADAKGASQVNSDTNQTKTKLLSDEAESKHEASTQDSKGQESLLVNQNKIRKLISHLVRKHLTILLLQK